VNIALIKPSLGERRGRPYRTPAVLEPIVFGLIAGATPPDVELRLIDERLEDVPFGEAFDLVAITVETFTARRSYQIAQAFRQRGVKVILGGFHPTLLPEEASRYADSIAIGEVEAVWPRVIADLARNRLESRYQPESADVSGAFRIDRSIFRGKSYLPLALVETSRGCAFDCDFCSVRRFYGKDVRFRPIPELVDELERLRRRYVFFSDDNIAASPAHARRLFRAIRPLGIRWVSQASLSSAAEPGFLDEMAASGCFAVIIGIESLSPANLKRMNKDWSLALGRLERLLDEYRARGILVYATFVFGYDDDTSESMRETVEFAMARRLFLANFNMLYPFPGTRVYEDLLGQGRLLYPRWWLTPGFRWERPAFVPRGMSVDELADGVAEARRRFHSLGSILRRSRDLQANLSDPFRMLVYLAGNLVSRLDIRGKTGLRLGFSSPDLIEGSAP